jgi:hypothetical protein
VTEEKRGYVVKVVEDRILTIRGQKVIVDADLARVYGVSTKRLNEQVKRNPDRFPKDFMFQLTAGEVECLRSQFATSNEGQGGRRYRPYVFTEHGAIMAANVLNSSQAIRMGVYVVRAFVRLREMLALHRDLATKLDELERKVGVHDQEIQAVFDAVRRLMKEPEKPKRRIGFTVWDKRIV